MQIGKEMAIPSILKIGNGALGKIGGYLKAENLDQVVLFFGNGLIDMFGELVMNSLKEAEVNVLEYNELDTVDIDDIITLAFAIPNKAKAVISIGGGKVIDAVTCLEHKPPENMRLFCGIFLLSVCRLPAPVTDFPVPVPLFWYRGRGHLFLRDWHMVSSWIRR